MELTAVSGGESIKVFVRVRPPDPHLESELDRSVCLDVTSQVSITVHCKPEPKVFTFDHVAGTETTQEDVFSSVGRPIIDSCMRGYNGTVFAYGQTGSGKTFTMIGPSDDSNNFTHELRGIIPRSFEYLFNLIHREKQKHGDLVEFLCKCSFLEIYNEQVFDLIDPASCGLHLRENMKHGVYVDGLLETSVSSAREAYEVLSIGWANRRVASTSMNRESSRSHAVFTLTIESKKKECRDSVAKLKSSVLNLVDLAGSERQRDTHTAGVRLKEAGSINKSLSALGNVIMALVDIANGKSRHVHYRDSKLTFLLRDSLGGNAKTNLVANVHPNARCFGESLSTLNFARRTKMIKNKAVINEDTTGNVIQLQAEIRRLKQQLERFKAGDVELPLSSGLYSDGSDDEKTIQELKEMLSASMTTRDKVEKDRMALLQRVEGLQKMCKQKDNFLQSTKMILKFRETHIANIEKKKGPASVSTSEGSAVSILKQEIEQLRYMVDHHPDVSKYAREALDLKAEIKRIKAESSGGKDLSKELARTHKYTLQLERQLRHFLVKDGSSSPLTKQSSTQQSETTLLELESLKARCKQLATDLDKARKALQAEKDDFHLKETKLEANLTAVKKANLELERSIEALKLKNSVEKATLNDMHMNTIKSMLTPRRDLIQPRKSIASTPYSKMQRADSDPVQQLSFSFNGVVTPQSKPSTIFENSGTNEVSFLTQSKAVLHRTPKIENEEDSGDVVKMTTTPIKGADQGEELNIEGALTDELKILQDKNRHSQQQIEDLEATVLRLGQDKSTFEAQIRELTQLNQSERQASQARETECVEKVSALSSQIATLISCNTVLDSEVVDLRVCLRSADKELAEVKTELKGERHSYQKKLMENMQRIGELEQLVSTQTAGWERSTEQLQTLQDEVETIREELTFKDHRMSELAEAVSKEKEQNANLEKEVQGLLEKLASEVEKNTTLSLELQESSHGKEELVTMVNESSQLKSGIKQLEEELQSQLTLHKHELEEAEKTVTLLVTRQSSDELAITGLMSTIQELREESSKSEAKATSLSKEVEDSNKELSKAAAKIDQLTIEVSSMKSDLSEQIAKFDRDVKRVESEKEVILDDLDGLNEQYQQLQNTFTSQSKSLDEAGENLKKLGNMLEEKDAELTRLYNQQRERRESFSKVSTYQVTSSADEIEELKQRLDRATDMISKYEVSQDEKNKELRSLKDELACLGNVRLENNTLESQVTSLQCKIMLAEKDLTNTRDSLQLQLNESLLRTSSLELDLKTASIRRDKSVLEIEDLKEKCKGQTKTIDALTQQMARYKSYEEALFVEKEKLRSQLETLQEERTKLATECEKLAKENAVISGHQNVRQKIQYHATVKIENNKLKEEVIQLRGRLKQKNEQVSQLHQLLTEKELQPTSLTNGEKTLPSNPKRYKYTDTLTKENVLPKHAT